MDTNIALEIAKAIQDNKVAEGVSSSAANQTTVMIVSSIVGLIGTMFTGVMAYLMNKVKVQNEKSAVAVKEVADTLSETTVATGAKLDVIHTLTNSNMGATLRQVSALAREVADLKNDPVSIARAIEAERVSLDHQIQQKIVDAKYPGGVPPAGV